MNPSVTAAAALALLALPVHAAGTEVCSLSGSALRAKVEAGAAEIAEAYARTSRSDELSLDGSSADAACNWTCGSPRVITPLVKAFNFLQYNCNKPTPDTRRPVGRKTDSQMGLSVTDEEYRNATDKIFRSGSAGVGDLMRVPPALVQAAQDGSVKKLTDQVEKIPGAGWIKFSSTSVNNPPDGAARVLIRLLDGKSRFEQWIQIAINNGTGKLGRNVDFLAVQLVPDPTSPLNDGKPVVAFRGFSRTDSGFELEGPGSKPPHELSKCYSCHPTGLRAIIPAGAGTTGADGRPAIKPVGTIPLTGEGNITQISTEMPNGLAEVGPVGYKAEHNGPALGPTIDPSIEPKKRDELLKILRERREDFVANGIAARPGRAAVAGCAAKLKEPRRKAVVGNMDCQSCHDGETERRILNAGTSIETLFHKVVESKEAQMPPKDVWDADPSLKLNQSERKILFECLKAEYAEILQDWLTSDLLLVP